MNNNNSAFNADDQDSSFDIKKEFFKYLFFWKYFILSLTVFLILAFVYNRFTPKVYETNAKILILDKKDKSLELPSASDLFTNSKINLENELEIIKSYAILEQVVKNLELTTSVYLVGDVMESLVIDYPFTIKSNILLDASKEMKFHLECKEEGLLVVDYQNNEKEYLFKDFSSIGNKHNLPFEVSDLNKSNFNNYSYNVSFSLVDKSVTFLKKSIVVSQVGKQSDIIAINYKSTNPEISERIINELIEVFNQDGIRDNQLIHKRTIDFVNDRYAFLSIELDSIEQTKQNFKRNNSLIDFKTNSVFSLERSSSSQEVVFANENEIFIVSSLLESLSKLNVELLPSNLGLSDININVLITSYNTLLLDKKKLTKSAGPRNPSIKQLDSSIIDIRKNIISSLNNYLSQLKSLNIKFSNQFNKFDTQVSGLPQKEKFLRAIERNQEIKEALYLFLLQKREEAEVSYAVTEPSIKVVDYAMSSNIPFSPNTKLIYLAAILFAILLPIGLLYIVFLFDTKIQSREDIESHNSSLNVLGEIPFFDINETEKIFADPTARSIVSESFRMLMSNTKYLFKDNNQSNVILVTSSIKGEGKTLSALNLSLSFASLNKKVLLIGCDLRNPQIHKYLDEDKNQKGLVDFLVDNKSNWQETTLNKFDKIPNHHILLSGALPPNPLYLINNGNMEIFLDQAKKEFDYIVIDSAPTLLVADTKSLFDQADAIIYLTRCNVTEKEILNHIASSNNESKASISVVLNGVGQKNAYGYSYGYKYGYGYNYKYSYNYGYGYGYEEDKS